MRAAAVLAGLLALSGCISSSGAASSWIDERAAEAEGGYPSLRDVPRGTTANTDPAYWARVEADLMQAKAELESNPRNEPAPAQGTDEFVNQAREELEESRDAHPE